MISVTQALSSYNDFSAIPPGILQAAADRGSRVHRACAAYASGFPALGLHGEDRGFYNSFFNWFNDYVSEVIAVEIRLESPLGFTGALDLACRLSDGRCCIVDYKTPAIESPLWRAQIAAYCDLAAGKFGGTFAGMALMLRKDGKAAKGIVYQYQVQDFAAFVSSLNSYRYFKGDK